jgi:Tetratricopeptide repeat/BRCA1 C Terminus (BRCT) domain
MPEASSDALLFEGKRVAFTGRLASMTRADGVALVRKHGGRPVSTVARHTSFLIVGQDGWPLQADGRLTSKLRKAQALKRGGCEITVIAEEEMLSRLGLEQHSEGVRRLYSTAQLGRLLKIPGDRLRKWMAAGLIHAVDKVNGVSTFDYTQVASARALAGLLQAGVSVDRLRRSIRQMQSWLGDFRQPLLQLAALENNGDLLVRLEDGLAEPTGQRHFDFADPIEQSTVTCVEGPATADEWFERACEHEDAGRLEAAVDAYRETLLAGGADATTCFNLANALAALGKREQAIERYYQCVEIDARFPEAWNNLAVLLSYAGRQDEAARALGRALQVDPHYSDAHYNLADLLDETGREAEARIHFRAYLHHDRRSEWAAHARKRLAGIGT